MLITLRRCALTLLVVFCGILVLGACHALLHPDETVECEFIKCVEAPQLHPAPPALTTWFAVESGLIVLLQNVIRSDVCFSRSLPRAPPSPS